MSCILSWPQDGPRPHVPPYPSHDPEAIMHLTSQNLRYHTKKEGEGVEVEGILNKNGPCLRH